MTGQGLAAVPLPDLEYRMKSLARKLRKVGDQHHRAAPERSVLISALQLADVQTCPVVERTLSERQPALALHLNVDLLAPLKAHPQVERNVLVTDRQSLRLSGQHDNRLDRHGRAQHRVEQRNEQRAILLGTEQHPKHDI